MIPYVVARPDAFEQRRLQLAPVRGRKGRPAHPTRDTKLAGIAIPTLCEGRNAFVIGFAILAGCCALGSLKLPRSAIRAGRGLLGVFRASGARHAALALKHFVTKAWGWGTRTVVLPVSTTWIWLKPRETRFIFHP